MKIPGILLALLFASLAGLTAAKRPNIIFIFTDDHCQQALSAYDAARVATPNMDRIAREGWIVRDGRDGYDLEPA